MVIHRKSLYKDLPYFSSMERAAETRAIIHFLFSEKLPDALPSNAPCGALKGRRYLQAMGRDSWALHRPSSMYRFESAFRGVGSVPVPFILAILIYFEL